MNDVLNSPGYTQAAWWNRDSDRRVRTHGGNCGVLQPAG